MASITSSPQSSPVVPRNEAQSDGEAEATKKRFKAILNPASDIQKEGIRKLKITRIVDKVFIIASLIFFGLSIAFLALSQAQKLPAMLPVYTFSLSFVTILAFPIISCGKKKVAEKYDIRNLEEVEEALTGYIPPNKKKAEKD